MKLYLCRHGETVLNVEKRWQGQCDSPLTKKGLEQSKKMSDYLANKKIDVIFSSPLARAKQTASIIKKVLPGVPYFELEELMERNNGKADGMSIEESEKKYPFLRRASTDIDVKFPEGESYRDLLARVKPFVKMLFEKYFGKTVLVVAHGGTNRMILAILFSLTDDEIVRFTLPTGLIYEVLFSVARKKIYHIKDGKRAMGFYFRK